ncbi:MAG: hypothetical protein FJZ61_00055 [Chlamydiae bacterium]|nr:hypothetical protein [Chlamydiota bacterium]
MGVLVRLLKFAIFLALVFGTFYVASRLYRNQQIESCEAFFDSEEKIALEVLKPKWGDKDPVPNLDQERIKVLVIEGGGAQGLYALRILDYLEKKTGKPICELYDVMGGSSIGSLLVSLLSIPQIDNPKKPLYSAEQIIQVFSETAHRTLEPTWKEKILSGYGLLSPILQNQKFIKVLQSFYGNMLFSETINHLVLYGYNFNTSRVSAFENRGPPLQSADPVLYQLIGSTTSPFGIAPVNKILLSPLYPPQFIGDAAFVVNNPLEDVVYKLTKAYPNKKFLINNIIIKPKELENTINFPFYSGWLEATIRYQYLQVLAHNQMTREALQTLSSVYKIEYMLEMGLDQNNEWLEMNSFDFSKKNLKKIDNFAKLILSENKDALDKVAAELLKD